MKKTILGFILGAMTTGIIAIAGDFPPTKAASTTISPYSIQITERWTETGSTLTVSGYGSDKKMYNWYSDEAVWKLWKTNPATTTVATSTATSTPIVATSTATK